MLHACQPSKGGNTALCKWKQFGWGGFTLHRKTDGGWILTQATSIGNSQRFSRPSALSLILRLFVSLLVKSKAPLSLVSKCTKNSKEHGTNILTRTYRATLPSPGCFCSLLWLFHTQTVSVLQRALNRVMQACYPAFRAQQRNLKWNGSRRFRSGPLLSKRTMSVDFGVIGRKG